MNRTAINLLLSLSIIFLLSCRESRTLRDVETLLETDPRAADSILSSMPQPTTNRDRALYAVLKTQAEYKQYKPITSDSLILTATRYYGTNRKNYHAALAWYTQGCVYTELHDDVSAIDAYLKAMDLFPDTLIRYYYLTESCLARSYYNKSMYDESQSLFSCCRNNAIKTADSTLLSYTDFQIALILLQKRQFNSLDTLFLRLVDDKNLSLFYRNQCLIELAKYHLYYTGNNDTAYSFLNQYRKVTNGSLGIYYSLKGDLHYQKEEFDSAYYCYQQTFLDDCDIYTICNSYKKLCELSLLDDNAKDAYEYGKLYTESLDSIRIIRNANEIASITISHKAEIEKIRTRELHKRTIAGSLFITIIVIVILLVLYQSHKNLIYLNYIKLCDSMWSEINRRLPENGSECDYLSIGKAKFMKSPSYFSFLANNNTIKLSRDNKEAIQHDLSVAFSDLMIFMYGHYSSITQREIQFSILSFLGVDRSIICEIMDLSDDNYRKQKSRLKAKLGNSFNLYFGRQL